MSITHRVYRPSDWAEIKKQSRAADRQAQQEGRGVELQARNALLSEEALRMATVTHGRIRWPRSHGA
jgi:hypothetical protein